MFYEKFSVIFLIIYAELNNNFFEISLNENRNLLKIFSKPLKKCQEISFQICYTKLKFYSNSP